MEFRILYQFLFMFLIPDTIAQKGYCTKTYTPTDKVVP
jgi:hypothetical protein